MNSRVRVGVEFTTQIGPHRLTATQIWYHGNTNCGEASITRDKPVHRCDGNVWHLVWHVELIVQFIDHGEVRGQVHYLGVG